MLHDVVVRVDTDPTKAAEISGAVNKLLGPTARSVKVVQVTIPFVVDGYDTKKKESVRKTVMATDPAAAEQEFETADVKPVRVTRGRSHSDG